MVYVAFVFDAYSSRILGWFNRRRLHSAAADPPPAQLGVAHYCQHPDRPEPEHSNR